MPRPNGEFFDLMSRSDHLYVRTLSHMLETLRRCGYNSGEQGRETIGGQVRRKFWRSATSALQILLRDTEVIACLPGSLTLARAQVLVASSEVEAPEEDDMAESMIMTENMAMKAQNDSNQAVHQRYVIRAEPRYDNIPSLPERPDEKEYQVFLKKLYGHPVYGKVHSGTMQLSLSVHAHVIQESLKRLYQDRDQPSVRTPFFPVFSRYIGMSSAPKTFRRFMLMADDMSTYIYAEMPAQIYEDGAGLLPDFPLPAHQVTTLSRMQVQWAKHPLKIERAHLQKSENKELTMIEDTWLGRAQATQIYTARQLSELTKGTMRSYDKDGRKLLLEFFRTVLARAIAANGIAKVDQINFRTLVRTNQIKINLKRRRDAEDPECKSFEDVMELTSVRLASQQMAKTSSLAIMGIKHLKDFVWMFIFSNENVDIPHGPFIELLKWILRGCGVPPPNPPRQRESSDDDDAILEQLNAGMTGLELDASSNAEIEEIRDTYHENFSIDGLVSAWPFACYKWIRISFAAYENLCKLIPETADRNFQAQIAKLDIVFLKTSFTQTDNQLLKISETIERFARFHGQDAKGYTELYAECVGGGQEEWDVSKTSGKIHCETTLLALWHLVHDPANKVNLEQDLDAVIAELRVKDIDITSELLLRFKGAQLAATLAMSKRCCPCCSYFVDLIQQVQVGLSSWDMMFGGFHSTYFKVILPPTMSADCGVKIISHLERKLNDTFHAMMKLKQDPPSPIMTEEERMREAADGFGGADW